MTYKVKYTLERRKKQKKYKKINIYRGTFRIFFNVEIPPKTIKERKTFVEDVKRSAGRDGASGHGTASDKAERDPMKFRNGDVRLDDAIKHNGGHIVLSGTNILFDSSW
jgi:hypothetical protein